MPTRVTLVLALVLVTGCPPWFDTGEPIAIVPDDSWIASDVALLAGAASCWNLQFGTRLVVGDVGGVRQRVNARISEFICVNASGNFQPGTPADLAICAYYPDSKLDFFTVVLHELGHVVNILPHTREFSAVMAQSEGKWNESIHAFADADFTLFHQANPDITGPPPCPRVIIDTTVFAFDGASPCSCPE